MLDLDSIDKSNMRAMIEMFPEMLESVERDSQFYSRAMETSEDGLKGVCIVGMGGSSIAGEISRGLLSSISEVPILTVQNYSIPKTVDKDWAVVGVSYSGNTEETLSAVSNASSRGCNLFLLSTGGKLGRKFENIPLHFLPPGLQPRAALPIILSVLYPLVETLIGEEVTEFTGMAQKVKNSSSHWGKDSPAPWELAKSLQDSIPVFVGWNHLVPVAYRAKCQICENAKSVSYHLAIPECDHNEIEAIPRYAKFSLSPVFLRSTFESKRISARFDITADICDVDVVHIRHPIENRLEEVLAHVHFLDQVSIELAEILQVDPVRVDKISELKRRLAKI